MNKIYWGNLWIGFSSNPWRLRLVLLCWYLSLKKDSNFGFLLKLCSKTDMALVKLLTYDEYCLMTSFVSSWREGGREGSRVVLKLILGNSLNNFYYGHSIVTMGIQIH